MDELHVIMMSYRGRRGAVPNPVYKVDPLSRLGRSRARIPARLEAALFSKEAKSDMPYMHGPPIDAFSVKWRNRGKKLCHELWYWSGLVEASLFRTLDVIFTSTFIGRVLHSCVS